MNTKKHKVYLSLEEEKQLTDIVKNGKHSAKKITRATILLHLNENAGKPKLQKEIAALCRVSVSTVHTVSIQYCEDGLESVLTRKHRETPPIQPIATGDVEAKIIALSCSKPPQGRSRWTLRLLEEKVVELGIVPQISDNTIGRLLKKHHLNLT